MTDSSTRYLAIDYGMKRVGLALTDPLKILASPFGVLQNNDLLMRELGKIIHAQNICLIILGYPLKEDGSKTTVTDAVMKLKKELEEKFSLPVTLVDERYSSSIAGDRVRETVVGRQKRRNKGLIDTHAAAIILEDYLRNHSA